MKFIIFVVLFVVLSGLVNGQGFEPPAPGKSVVYFAKLNVMGFNLPVEYYNNDRFIGCFFGRGYLRYECDPGLQLFWISSTKTTYLTADLLPDAIYVVIVDVIKRPHSTTFELRPVNSKDSAIPKVEKMTRKKSTSDYSPSELIENTGLLSFEINTALRIFEDAKANGELFYHITPDMGIRIPLKNLE